MEALLSDADVRDRLRWTLEAETQAVFANRAGVSQALVSSVLRGERRPNAAIAAALGLEDMGRRWRQRDNASA